MKPADYKPWETFPHRHLLSLRDWSGADIAYTLDVAATLKAWQKKRIPHPLLSGKTLAMIFTKPSTRPRLSVEVGMYQLESNTRLPARVPEGESWPLDAVPLPVVVEASPGP